MDENQLLDIFRRLDKNGNGRVGRDEFRSVFSQYIGSAFADDIFRVLDYDGDGEMSLKELLSDLRNYMQENALNFEGNFVINNKLMINERRRSDTRLAWSHVVEAIGEPAVRKFLNNSARKLEKLYLELQTHGSSPELVTHFEGALSSLLEDVKQVLDDNEKLKFVFNKEKESHLQRLRGLEEELDAQVAKVEAEAREEARLRFEQEKKDLIEKMEAEKKDLIEKMEAEMVEMQTHLKLFQKVNTILTQKKEEKNNLKYESAFQDQELRSSLSDTRTSLAVVHAELARIKAEYESKCRELSSHHEVILQYIEQSKQVQRQVDLLHETNKNLQDTNDNLLAVIERTGGRLTPGCCSRTGSDSNSSPSETTPSIHIIPSFHDVAAQSDILHEQNNESGAQYVMQRLMEDIDSGHSTLRDPIECDSDHKSLQEEFCNLSDTDFLRPLDSNENKFAHLTLRRHSVDKTESLRSNMTSYETISPDRTFKVVLAGDAAVGKSCFIHRFCKGNFTTRLGSTLGVDFQIKTIRIDEKYVALQLWDTAGQERFRSMTRTYFRRADGVILLYDVTSEKSFLSIRQWVQSINESADKSIPILICGNKVDLRENIKNMGARCVETKNGEILARDYNAIFFETSSKTNKHVCDAMIAITREMLLREDVEVQTSALNLTNSNNSSCCNI